MPHLTNDRTLSKLLILYGFWFPHLKIGVLMATEGCDEVKRAIACKSVSFLYKDIYTLVRDFLNLNLFFNR